MTPAFRINVLDLGDDDSLLHYQIHLSDGWQATSLDFYGYEDAFSDFGRELVNFPASIDSTLTFQVGKDDTQWAYYLLLEVFCHQPNGASVIRVVVKNVGVPPSCHSCEFYIASSPAPLNRLGQGLRGWKPRQTREYNWEING